ncbi:hypothetical protein AKJ51_01535 [candidate division MSBL1 archaeon SCGC-AAA382A20]|uniref:5'-3' exonuclease domain-containing protein n=1 Tax=candidate division MSBL1 archaeon SCGC-AAA382A20 TaxID=1698280 RepID=A0A133VLN3_9EURY|nr:hypothetical protein AKJ51_01535 [candidate division MSBL1 archaeon SCGC-AAA382A20]
MSKKIIFDGGYLAHRTKSIPFFRNLVVKEKRVGLAFGIMNTIKKYINEGYEDFAVAWDKGFASHRREILDSYKSSRKEAIKSSISAEEWGFTETFLGFFGIKQYYHPELEADDVMGYFAKQTQESLYIFTVDKDLYQLVSDKVSILHPEKGLIDDSGVVAEFGVAPKEIPKMLAIAGDRVDDIKGIEGIGYKTASKYINKGLPSLTERQQGLIVDNGDVIDRNLKLTKLKTDIEPLEIKYNKNLDEFERLINEYEMLSLKELVEDDEQPSITDFVR